MRNFKRHIAPFVIGIILGVCTMSVFAGYAISPDLAYGPILGYKYTAHSATYLDSSEGIFGMTGVYSDDSGNIPTGYMGGQAFVIRDYDGATVESSTWQYNTTPTTGIGVSTVYVNTAGTYYNKGISRAYNGNGYDMYTLKISPSQTVNP